ncbi:MAG: hypothetical protein D6705_13210 [Deltaproteobacteria bacterium]|nr:MAG: hypothetical protein D6705_13210 [Deltaproteobacteria bacterium]
MFRPLLVGIVVSVAPQVSAAAPPDEGPHNLPIVQPGEPVPLPPPTEAHCTIQVDGIGAVETETDYLPHVITCENGGANLEALKAQAIAARSVAYYAMENSGSICDGQGCQVYTCGATPQAKHYQAVEETAGMYLRYNGNLTYGFYVAGDPNTAPPSCVGNDANASTEKYVTYNEGKTGTAVEQTTLGWVFDPQDAGYGQNRGCMSQWGSRCLENDQGYDYVQILRFYYGDDIEIVQAPGPCVMGGGTTTGGGSTGGGSTSTTGPEPTTGDPTSTSGGGTTGNASDSATGSTGAGSTGAGTTTSGTGGDGAGDAGGTEGGTSGGDGGDGGAALPNDYGPRADSGCACRHGSANDGALVPMSLLGLVLLRLRRRNRP